MPQTVSATGQAVFNDAQRTLHQSGISNGSATQDTIEDDGDWLVSNSIVRNQDRQQQQHDDDEFDMIDDDGELIGQPRPEDIAVEQSADHDDEYADMADYEDDNIIVDAAADTTTTTADNTNIIKVRTYDLSITYDKYYQTPRIWMTGKSSSDQPLSARETMQDVISDSANKTVTIEQHPHVPGPHASIHPCQHGAVMKTIVRNLIQASNCQISDSLF
jgi:ubiquitin-like-conjugating enzyme ATG3